MCFQVYWDPPYVFCSVQEVATDGKSSGDVCPQMQNVVQDFSEILVAFTLFMLRCHSGGSRDVPNSGVEKAEIDDQLCLRLRLRLRLSVFQSPLEALRFDPKQADDIDDLLRLQPIVVSIKVIRFGK